MYHIDVFVYSSDLQHKNMPHTGVYIPHTGVYIPHTGVYIPHTGVYIPHTGVYIPHKLGVNMSNKCYFYITCLTSHKQLKV